MFTAVLVGTIGWDWRVECGLRRLSVETWRGSHDIGSSLLDCEQHWTVAVQHCGEMDVHKARSYGRDL